MKKWSALFILLIQISITAVVLFIIYIIYALADIDEADMVNGLAFLVFQPLLGCILTSLTIVACLLAGLPIRLVKRLKHWWYTKPLFPLLGLLVGLWLLVLAFYPAWKETQQVIIDNAATQKPAPNTFMSVTGWFMTAFSLLHFYPQSLFYFFRRKKSSNA